MPTLTADSRVRTETPQRIVRHINYAKTSKNSPRDSIQNFMEQASFHLNYQPKIGGVLNASKLAPVISAKVPLEKKTFLSSVHQSQAETMCGSKYEAEFFP